ncbi:MAG: TolC family protein [Rickettsiales bacterium]|jgi:outer membrane protein TolC|nr:TolC family protein [Rickettsiales bacterium]
MRFIKILFLFLISVSFVSAEGKRIPVRDEKKEVKSTKNDVSLDMVDVLDMAFKNNPRLREQWLKVDISKNEYEGAKSRFFPDISGSVGINRDRTGTNGYSASIGLEYLLFDFGGRKARVKSFEYGLEKMQYDTNSYLRNFTFDVLNAYYTLLSSMAKESAAREAEISSREAYKAANTRYKVGLVALTDKLQAETHYNQESLSYAKAKNTTKINRARLNYLLNLSPESELSLSIPVLDMSNKDDKIDGNIKNLVESALKNRDDLKSLNLEKEIAKENVWSARSGRLPSFNVTARYGYDGGFGGSRSGDDYWTAGVSASMPFFTGGKITSDIADRKLRLQVVNERMEDLIKNVELEVYSAYQNYLTARRTFDTSVVILKSAVETEKNVFGRYKNGKSSILDLLTAQTNLANAKSSYIESQYNWFIQRASLMKSLGDISFYEKGEL